LRRGTAKSSRSKRKEDGVVVDARTVEKLAKAWLAEAKRLRSVAVCACGDCTQVIHTKTRFAAGHDAKLLAKYRRELRQILESGR
jgi:hypothetical protein